MKNKNFLIFLSLYLFAITSEAQTIFGFPYDPDNNDNHALNAPIIGRTNNVDGTSTYYGSAAYRQIVLSDNYTTDLSLENNTMLVYPNPVINGARIVLGYAVRKNVLVGIIDLDGRIVRMYEFPVGTQQMDVDMGFVHPGIYSVSVFQKNKPVLSTRVVKE